MKSFSELARKINLNAEQTEAVKDYILEMLVDNLELMKKEYNEEIDRVINGLRNEE